MTSLKTNYFIINTREKKLRPLEFHVYPHSLDVYLFSSFFCFVLFCVDIIIFFWVEKKRLFVTRIAFSLCVLLRVIFWYYKFRGIYWLCLIILSFKTLHLLLIVNNRYIKLIIHVILLENCVSEWAVHTCSEVIHIILDIIKMMSKRDIKNILVEYNFCWIDSFIPFSFWRCVVLKDGFKFFFVWMQQCI